MDQVIAPLFSASVDMGKKAVVASSAAAVGALGAGALALAAPGVVSGASALLTKGTAFVAENGPGLLASINNPANYGKAFLLGAVGKVMTENTPIENNYDDIVNGISSGLPSEFSGFSDGSTVMNECMDGIHLGK